MQRYVPEFVKRWQPYAQPVGASWRCDETYIRIKGQWSYLYRAVDQEGQTVDFFLSDHRDIAAAKRFFAQAIEKRGVPELDFIQSGRVTEGVGQALEEGAWDLYEVVVFLRQ